MFERLWIKHVVKRYATALPEWLAQNYGSSDYYTIPQIRAAVRALKLNPKFITLAYGMYLPEEEFNTVKDEMPGKLDYSEARLIFLDAMPVKLESRDGTPGPVRTGY